ncbi:MAG TPA: hypothetical protein PKN48_00635 [Bacteroidales bacterium]|nr:hypothetical protein [Bacteroidales bacterium]
MAYTKPGVEITQEQRSQTPVFITPELNAVVVGKGYHWQDPMLDESLLDTDIASFDGTEVTFHLSGINSTNYNVSGEESLVIIDLVQSADTIYHLQYGTDFTVSNNQVTILADGTFTGPDATIRVGYRADQPDSEGFKQMSSISDIKTLIGDPVSWNPLAYGAMVAQQQFSRAIYTYGLDEEATADYTEAFSALEMQEVYAIACMSHNSTIVATAVAHANDMSLATNKKERIVICNRVIPSWTGVPHAETTANKLTTAEAVRDYGATYQEKRLFLTFPDWGYVEEKRHISTIKKSWVKESFNSTLGTVFTTNTDDSYYYCKFAMDMKVGSTRYKKGESIDDTKWQALVDEGYSELTVLSPVPGFYYDAAVVGQVIGKRPEQPLTNVPISGIDRTYGSWDYFTESQLNTIAEGGYYIMTQSSTTSPVVSRHQMSTNVLSIAKRELSITTAIDYTAKFIRKVMNPYVGRYIINDKFLSMVDSTLSGIGAVLIVAGALDDYKVVSVEQNQTNPDSIDVEIDILPLYPVNYIRITLVF